MMNYGADTSNQLYSLAAFGHQFGDDSDPYLAKLHALIQ